MSPACPSLERSAARLWVVLLVGAAAATRVDAAVAPAVAEAGVVGNAVAHQLQADIAAFL